MNATVSGNLWLRFNQAPRILRAYVVFLLVTVALFLGEFYPPISAAIIPYTGWSGLTFYHFTLYFALASILAPPRKLIYGVAPMLGLAVLFGAFDTYQHTWGTEAGSPDFDNPYLTYHPCRPIFTIALPAFWQLLLMSPAMRKWVVSCQDTTGIKDADRQ